MSWYNKKYTRNILHSNHDFRRKKKYKGFLIFIGIIIFLAFIYFQDIGGIKTSIQNINLTNLNFGLKSVEINFISIKDLNQNPESYVGKNISIRGILNNRLGGYSLEDDEGYWVWIGNNEFGNGCIENQREYNYNSQTYSAKGIFLSPESCNLNEYGISCRGMGMKYEWHLECSSPLN